jgi:hypothetical protein
VTEKTKECTETETPRIETLAKVKVEKTKKPAKSLRADLSGVEASGNESERPEVDVYPKIPSRRKSFIAKEGSAFQFVQQFRRESLKNPAPVPSKSKEQEISEIGVSMQQRLIETATASIVPLRKNRPSIISEFGFGSARFKS